MGKIEILKIGDEYVVQWQLANGATGVQAYGGEREARIYANGFQDGFGAVAALIGGGVRFDGRVREA